MADESPATPLPRGSFIIVEDTPVARHATYEEALSLAQRGHRDNPQTTFLVCQIVASVKPQVLSTITHHRF